MLEGVLEICDISYVFHGKDVLLLLCVLSFVMEVSM